MGIPIEGLETDGRGYVFVTDAADRQIRQKSTPLTANVVSPIPARGGRPDNLTGRRRIHIRTVPAVTSPLDRIFVGGAGLSTTNGYPVPVDEELILEVTDDIQLYAVVTADADVRTLELA